MSLFEFFNIDARIPHLEKGCESTGVVEQVVWANILHVMEQNHLMFDVAPISLLY